MKPTRQQIAALSLSATALVALIAHEGYSDKPIIPVKGDRPTIGFGSTFRDDGSPVAMSDKPITPQRAIARSLAHIQRDERGLKQCVTAPLTQAEYDVLVDFSYQYGIEKTCASRMVALANEGRYADACNAYMRYRFVAGYDCSTPGNKRCWGVWERSLERAKKCKEGVA